MADRAGLAACLSGLRASAGPIRGVFHGAMVLADHPLVAIPFAFVLANGFALVYWYLIERHYPTVRRAIRRSAAMTANIGWPR